MELNSFCIDNYRDFVCVEISCVILCRLGCVARLRVPCTSPLHDTLPVIARMLLGIAQEILGPIRVIEHMHRCWTEIGPTLQTLPDMVHAMVNVVSLSCVQRTLVLLVRLRCMSLMILSILTAFRQCKMLVPVHVVCQSRVEDSRGGRRTRLSRVRVAEERQMSKVEVPKSASSPARLRPAQATFDNARATLKDDFEIHDFLKPLTSVGGDRIIVVELYCALPLYGVGKLKVLV
ncbi:hypothetical protein KCU69_g28, partial [Aureobasidium melanogenum]